MCTQTLTKTKTINKPVMPSTVCRTCLAVLKENSNAFFTLENSVSGMTTFREKLSYCVPELALDIVPDAVICTACSATLNLAYDFKTKCLEVENRVRQCLDRFSKGHDADNFHYIHKTSQFIDVKPNVSKTQHVQNCEMQNTFNQNTGDELDKKQPVAATKEKFLTSFVGISPRHIKSELDLEDNLEETNEHCVKTNDSHIDAKIFSLAQHIPNHSHLLTQTSKVKTKNDLNEQLEELTCTSNDNLKIETQKHFQNNFLRTLQTLRRNNVSNSWCKFEQVFEQLNLLKVVQTLADQGTEININGLENLPKQKSYYEKFDCYYCNRSFDRSSLLKTHMISHTGVKPFACSVCGKGCSHKGELNNHMRTHTGEKPFKCSVCGSSFSQISNMKIHMRTHTGEKPYKCDFCEKMFSHKCGMKVHMRTHTGERPYKCNVCCKTYTHKKDLDDHMRIHTGEKYRCTICLKEITYKKNLNAHMITHSVKNSSKLGLLNKSNMVRYYPKLAH